GDKDIQAAIKETSKYSVKSSDFLTDDDERNQEIVNDLEKGFYRERMLSYGGRLKQKHQILNLDDREDGNLINTSDEDNTRDEHKSTDGEAKARSSTAICNFHTQDSFGVAFDLELNSERFVMLCYPCVKYSLQPPRFGSIEAQSLRCA